MCVCVCGVVWCGVCVCVCVCVYTILPKLLGHPFLMKGLTTLVISMSTNKKAKS